MKIGKYLLILSLLASQAIGQIVITAGTGRPTTQPPIEAPTGRDLTPTRLNPLQPNAPVDERFFEGQCGPAYLSYGCNFMKSDGVSQMRGDSSNYAQRNIDGFQKNLNAENTKLDRDLSALRTGQAFDNSPAGIKIKEDLAHIDQLKGESKAINDSTFDLQIEASRANQNTVDANFGLAFKGKDTRDYRQENSKIETFVASNTLSGRIQAEYDRADAIEAKIMADGPKYRSERLSLTSDGRFALDISKLSLLEGNIDRSQLALKFGQRLLDTAINFAPLALSIAVPEAIIAGALVTAAVFAKDYYEARTGTRLIGGEKLTDADRAMAVLGASLGVITPVAALGKSLRSAAGAIELMGDLFKGGRIEVEAAEGAAAAVKQVLAN